MQHKANAQRLAGICYYWCAKARPRDNTFGFGPMSIVDIRNDRHSHRRMKAAPKNRVPLLSVCPSNSAEAFELPELPRLHSIYFISGSDTCRVNGAVWLAKGIRLNRDIVGNDPGQRAIAVEPLHPVLCNLKVLA